MRKARGGAAVGRRTAIGALSGAVGTAAMDLLLYRRYRRTGGTDSAWRWESAEAVTSWDDASAPGQLGERVARLLTGETPSDRWARPTTNAMHWATGIGWGAQYGALAAASGKHSALRALALGPVVWLAGYVVLPSAGVYKPMWEYDARTLAKDFTAHLVYGATTSAAFAALARHSTT
jgi:hypothetical protein